jgi:hypothetical protein
LVVEVLLLIKGFNMESISLNTIHVSTILYIVNSLAFFMLGVMVGKLFKKRRSGERRCSRDRRRSNPEEASKYTGKEKRG